MTYEETLKHFTSLQKRYTREHNGKMCEKVALAITAIKKQIPKEPIKQICGVYDEDSGNWLCDREWNMCPTCTERNEVYRGHKYCPKCGQHIKWPKGSVIDV